MKKILFNQDEFALISDEDFPLVSLYRWQIHRGKYTSYAATKINGHTVYMHRLILGLKKGTKTIADHKDGNGLNNQRSNLRKCTRSQNAMNSRMCENNKTGYKGVFVVSNPTLKTPKWQAQIKIKNKKMHLGVFNSPQEASLAYKKAALKFHGKFSIEVR